jgi:23S rRNA pseudouridine1911/1915/1917 synthase
MQRAEREDDASSSRDLIDIPLDVEEVGEGYRLDRYLGLRFARLSRARIHKMIDDGRVCCRESGKPLLKKAQRVRSGQKLLIFRPPPPESKEAPTFEVVYQDEELLVVNKPGHLAVHPSARYHHHTLTAALLARFGAGHGWEMAHRIDRETSGLMLFGQHGGSATILKDHFFERRIEKVYLAIVRGRLAGPVRIDLPLGQARRSKVLIRMSHVPVSQGGLEAITLAAPLAHASYRGEPISLVQIWLQTGRTHQIRAHFEAIGFPLLGDKLYGGDEEHFLSIVEGTREEGQVAEVLGLGRQALHAVWIRCLHPATQASLSFMAPWPDDLAAVMDFDPSRLLPSFPG